jgi:RNA polymerase-binding transcription factor
MDTQTQTAYKARLLALRKRLLREVDTTEEALREDVVKAGDLSSVPTHPADQDSEGLDAQLAIAQNEEQMLEEVEAALERIEAGTYGTCQKCGREIGKQRLEAIPYTSLCVECARSHHDEPTPTTTLKPWPRR